MVADRINKIGVSPTAKIAGKAIMMKAEGIDIVDLSVGEPDFPTPEHIKEAAKQAIDSDYTKYTMTNGSVELRKAIAKKLLEDNNLIYDINDIIVSNGAKQSLYNVVMSLVDEGDEVIIPAPFWVSYPEMVNIAKGKPVIVNTHEENGFKLTPDELKGAISANTKALILCNPSNPTGAAYTKEELEALASIIDSEDLYVISDEIYEKLIYGEFKFISFASIDRMKERTVLINGVSKAFAMTGWRIGYAAGPKAIIEGCSKIQSHSTSCASAISQAASVVALNGSKDKLTMMLQEFHKRRDYVMHRLKLIPGISCHNPEGAFYVFPNISSFFGKEFNGTLIRNSYGLAYYLLREAKVALIPGDAFGADDFIRISYATSMESLIKGLDRIEGALSKLNTPAKVKINDLHNTITKTKKPVNFESSITVEQRDAYSAEAEAYLKYNNYFEWNANINGVIVQLRTNVPHLYDFWMENWFPAQLKQDEIPHGIIYAIDGVVGREPHAFYNSDTNTGFLFNSDLYNSLRSLAFGLVTDVAEKVFNMHAVRGMSADYEGNGYIIIGPRGVKKTEIFYGLLNDDKIALHSSDLMFISNSSGEVSAENPERKIYIPTFTASVLPVLSSLFDRSKCENVVTRTEDCESRNCQIEDNCAMDTGSPYCYKASKESYAMLDPYWIGGMYKHAKKIKVKVAFIVRNDSEHPKIEELSCEEAVHILETGFVTGNLLPTNHKTLPFYNNHFLLVTPERTETNKKFYHKLFNSVKCYSINVGTESVDVIKNEIIEKLKNL